MFRLRFLFAIAGALVGLLAVSAPQAGAIGDDWQALHVHMAGSGSVTGSGGYTCPDANYANDCSKAYNFGTLVNLAASPDQGWMFGGWAGCLSTSNNICQVYLNKEGGGDTYVTATFIKIEISPSQQPLTVSVSGPGHVTGPGIDCPGDCSQSFTSGAWVTLQAQPEALGAFSGWSGACTGGPSAACVVKMDAARDVTASFAANIPIGTPRTLAVEVAGPGSGSVSAGSAINCPGDCSESYSVSADVTLTATPAPGSVFEGWSGACAGNAPTCQVTMSVSRHVAAAFTLAPTGPGQPGPDNPGEPGNPREPGPGQPSDSQPAGTCTISGTQGNDVLVGTPGRDVICGRSGNDKLIGKGGNDVLLGGLGADILTGGLGADRLLGGAGKDRLSGGAGKDRLEAGAGTDRLVGGGGADRLAGGRGVDLLLARDGLRDRVDGGKGRDRARVDRMKDLRRRIEMVF